MKEIPEEKNIDSTPQPADKKRSLAARIAIVSAWTIGGFIALVILLLAGATWWLTPARLTEIVNREASRNLYADVETHNIRFTLWSSWPHLRVEMDSMTIRSRVFDSIPSSIRSTLPADADFLASSGRFSGGINLLSLLRGEISLHDVDLGSLRLNLVTVNDSLSNFNIVPPDSVKTKIPHFTANRVRLLNPGSIRYRSLADSACANVDLRALSLNLTDKKKNRKDPSLPRYSDNYSLKILGNVDASVGDLSILRGFPFELGGDVALGFDPLRFATSDYHVNLGALHGNIDMRMQVGGDSSLDSFSWHFDNFDLLRILAYIPGLDLSSIESLDAPVTVNATARLTSPWRLSSNVLPSAEVDFNIVDGNMSYTMSDGRTCTLRHEGAGGRLIFDGVNPSASSFVVPPFRLCGEGVDLTIGADMTQLLGSPLLEASVEGNAMLQKLAAAFPFLNQYSLKGDVQTMAVIQGRIPPLSQLSNGAPLTHADVSLDGKIKLSDFSGKFAAKKITASAKTLEIDLDGQSAAGNLPRKIHLSGAGEGLALSIPGDNMKLALKDLKIAGEMDMASSGGRLSAGSSALSLTSGAEKVNLAGISLDLSADRLSSPRKVSDFKIPALWLADTSSLAFAPHSSQFLQVKLPKEARDFMAQWKAGMHLKVAAGSLTTPSFPGKNRLQKLDMTASFDSIVLNSLRLRSRSSAMAMRGSVSNLRQFLCSSTPAPLYLNLEVAMDTMQINQLAGAFLKGDKGTRLSASPDKQESDTIALLLPRNIVADIHATADETQYMNLHLYDLNTGLHMRDGNMRVEDLRISADFGHAFLNFNFNTSDIQRIGMKADLGLLDVDVVRFFDNFHTLLLMMPQMKNLEGEVSAEANFSLLSFPNMYVNVPSLGADIRVQGDGLTVHQSPFIRRITRMLLIHESGPLHIADMDVHASLHDNLLELYPFTFAVDRYRLKMEGLNNFDGDLYYHIGVEKSPVPFPFGINILGKFSHPKIRFGGAGWKIKKGEKITASVMEENRINIVAEGRKFLKEFLRKAAESDQ